MKFNILRNVVTIMIITFIGILAAGCTGTAPDNNQGTLTESKAQEMARDFVTNSPTFMYDGIEETLELSETLYPDMENTWQFVYRFDSRSAGYGDRSDQMAAQVITPHEAIVTVENGTIRTAVLDQAWDMINQRMLGSATMDAARQRAEEFVRTSPTFLYDGIEDTLEYTNSAGYAEKTISISDTVSEEVHGWEFTFVFESGHAGYGDRTGEMLAQVVTPHEAVIKVEEGQIKSAIMDGVWDMINQETLN